MVLPMISDQLFIHTWRIPSLGPVQPALRPKTIRGFMDLDVANSFILALQASPVAEAKECVNFAAEEVALNAENLQSPGDDDCVDHPNSDFELYDEYDEQGLPALRSALPQIPQVLATPYPSPAPNLSRRKQWSKR